MATASDLVHHAIAAGVFGQIQWDDRSDERARSNSALRGLTPEGIRRLLHDFVCGGGGWTKGGRRARIGFKPTPTAQPIIAIFGIEP